MSVAERVRRIAAANGLKVANRRPESGPVLLADVDFVFDPGLIRHIATHPGAVLTAGGRVVLAHAVDPAMAARLVEAMEAKALPSFTDGLTRLAVEQGIDLHNSELRKREPPFVLQLRPDTVRQAERSSYYGAYKGVTDLLTKYLWPELAFHLTRGAARIGMTPNMVTMIGAILCVVATFAFLDGRYWLGLAMGFVFMVLDTVDGKLARCTITSSKIGDVFDHGIDLVHPPFWWWAWAEGLKAYGLPLAPAVEMAALFVIVAGYILGRFIEGAFIKSFGMHIHVWRPIDSQFRLITARRNPNVVILAGALLFGRPDLGLLLVAAWTLLSLLFHLVRLAQAYAVRASGRPIVSWLG